MHIHTHWHHENDTAQWAQRLGACSDVIDACIELEGDLGAGKTTFVRHLLRALGVQGRVKSPTYAVVESYEVERAGYTLPIWHFDFYRFSDPQEWEDAGFRDIFATPGLKLVEWAQKVQGLLPRPDVQIQLRLVLSDDDAQECSGSGERQVTIVAHTDKGQRLLRELQA